MLKKNIVLLASLLFVANLTLVASIGYTRIYEDGDSYGGYTGNDTPTMPAAPQQSWQPNQAAWGGDPYDGYSEPYNPPQQASVTPPSQSWQSPAQSWDGDPYDDLPYEPVVQEHPASPLLHSDKAPRRIDVNGDGTINLLDLVEVAQSIGAKQGDPRYKPERDVDNNSQIDIRDLSEVGKYWGKKTEPLDRNWIVTEKESRLANAIKSNFGILIDLYSNDKFNEWQLKMISSALNSLDPELLKGLKEIRYDPTQGCDGLVCNTYDYDNKTVILAWGFSSDTVVHETAHHVDYEYYGFNAFRTLHKNSDSSKNYDYANDKDTKITTLYGKTNSLEDFATTFENYVQDTKKEFLRGIQQAQENKPVYLQKLLFVTDVFTKGHPDRTTIYPNGTPQDVAVMRDQAGKITSIGGISVNDLDGLNNFFTQR